MYKRLLNNMSVDELKTHCVELVEQNERLSAVIQSVNQQLARVSLETKFEKLQIKYSK